MGVTSAAYLALARLEAAGVRVSLDAGNRVKLVGLRGVDPALVEAVREHKAEIMVLLRLRLAEPHRLEEVRS